MKIIKGINRYIRTFQYISIGLAKIDYLEKDKLGFKPIINNTILFDAKLLHS
jgi:hypothetical protein